VVGADNGANSFQTSSTEELLVHLSRYGSTPEKRAAKAAARTELLARGTNTLHVLMAHAHLDNIALQVFTQELVEHLDKDEAARVLLGYLGADQPRARRMAAYFLGLHDTPQHASYLMPLLNDEEACGAAIRTLGKWKVRSAAPAITPFLKHEKEVRRVAAANALREIGDASGAGDLVTALEDPFFTVREAAQRALTGLGPAADRVMIRALPAARGAKLRCLIRALGQSQSWAARRAIRKFVQSADGAVAADAQEALNGQTQ
jgi:HEAT repeat protein